MLIPVDVQYVDYQFRFLWELREVLGAMDVYRCRMTTSLVPPINSGGGRSTVTESHTKAPFVPTTPAQSQVTKNTFAWTPDRRTPPR